MAGRSISLRQDSARKHAVLLAPRRRAGIRPVFILLILILIGLAWPALAQDAAIKGDVSVSTSGGFARIVLRFAEEVETDVRASNNIVVITFKTPVDVGVDRVNIGAAGYVSAARKDPDGKAIRLALSRKVSVNAMAAGERIFVDLLPENWTGLPPGLPQEVIDELARRAREAERRAREREQLARQSQQALVRVRVGRQPTFTRYVFELPSLMSIAADRSKDKLLLLFDAALKFDFGEAKAALPTAIASIDVENGQDTTQVHFRLNGHVDVRSFREDNAYIVDVVTSEQEAARDTQPAPPLPEGELKEVKVEAAVEPPDASTSNQSAADATRPLKVTVDAPVPQPRPASAPPREPQAKPQGAVAADMPASSASAPAAPAPAPAPPVAAIRSQQSDASPQGAAETAPQAVAPNPPESSKQAMSEAPGRSGASAPSPEPAPQTGNNAPQTQRTEEPMLKARDLNAPVVAEVRQQGENLRITFPFAVQTSTAVFRRFDTLWFVADTNVPIDIRALTEAAGELIRNVEISTVGNSQVIRIRLHRPKLASLGEEGAAWTLTLGDLALEPTRPVAVLRNLAEGARANVSIAYDNPQRLLRLSDPEIGDTLIVATAFGPPRGLLKPQDFVEFRALASTHGIAVQPLADEVTAELGPDRITIGRPGGLTLSLAAQAALQQGQPQRTAGFRPLLIDNQLWGFDRQAEFVARRDQLIRVAAEAPAPKRTDARLELARFFLAREMYFEAKAVLDVTVGDDRIAAEDPSALVLRAVAAIMVGRADEGLKDLANPIVGNQQAAPLWRALALMRQGKWAEARDAFKAGEGAIATLPLELQRAAVIEAARAAIEARDFADAARLLNEFDVLGLPRELQAQVSVLRGRLDEGLGRLSDALAAYRTAADSWDRPHAAQGQLREIILRHSLAEIARPEAIAALEGLTTVWRGDETEIEALQLLARLYTEEGRFRDAFRVMRTAMLAHPGSEMTRRIQEEAATTFDALFLAGKGDAMPAIEAVSLFYDFRELTPIGRRGDEMIRRLADRLVSVDLLDQAAELLQHQIDHRLQGVARAHVGVKLAVIQLMNRKPDRALQVLRSTRAGEMPNDLRSQRLVLEARALSDTGRHDLALEVVSGMSGREVERLKADIYWSGKRWRQAAEQIERLYGERWRDFAPLSEPERADILRAGIAYALAEDALGLDRFRQRYLPKMSETPDQRAFEIVTMPYADANPDFKEVAKTAGNSNPLDGLLREMRARYPDFGASAPSAGAQPANRPQASPATERRSAGG